MIDILERLANSSCNESSHELQCRCFDAAEEVSRLRAALQTQAEEAAKHNAWMSQVHGLCFDLGIAPGHIEDRLFEAIGRVNMLIEQRDELVGALQSAINQVEYLHRKFQETGSGNGFIAQCQQLLSKAT